MTGPNPDIKHPIATHPRVGFLKGLVTSPNIEIGAFTYYGAKSVVTHDVPPYAIVAGNPAKVVKMRFDEFTVRRLLKAAWWDWPVDKISRNLDAIRGAEISRLEAAV